MLVDGSSGVSNLVGMVCIDPPTDFVGDVQFDGPSDAGVEVREEENHN